jgi:hypothetical protein
VEDRLLDRLRSLPPNQSDLHLFRERGGAVVEFRRRRRRRKGAERNDHEEQPSGEVLTPSPHYIV